MAIFDLPLNEQALEELDFYSKEEGISVVDMIMDAIRVRLEDLEDIRDADEIMARIEAGEPTYMLEEVRKELGL